MVRWVVGLIPHGGPIELFSFQPLLHDWCSPVCGMEHIKISLSANGKRRAHVVMAAGFLSRYMNGSLSYARRHITVLKCVECVVQ